MRGPALRRGAARGAGRPPRRRSWRSASRCCARPAPPAKGGPTARPSCCWSRPIAASRGAFNSNLIKEARRRIAALEAEGYTVDLHAIGKKGAASSASCGRKLALERVDIGDKPTAAHAAELAEPLIDAFAAGDAGPASSSCRRSSTARSRRRRSPPQVLPVERAGADGARRQRDYILAPSAEAILEELLPLYVRERGLSRAGRDGGGRARRAPHRDEERDGQRAGTPGHAQADVQPPAAGGDHAGDRGDRGRRGGAGRVAGTA